MDRIKVDLHLHTSASDGTWTPNEAVNEAVRAQIGMIAITDHESVDNVLETEYYAKNAGLEFIRGAEISSSEGKQSFHILGYHFDLNNKRLKDLLGYNKWLLESQDNKTVKTLVDKGWQISLKEYDAYEYDRTRGGWKSINFLIDKGICRDVKDFFTKIFVEENDLGFPIFPAISDVIEVIHHAGGVALLAHAGSELHGPGLKKTLEDLAKYEFDGFECYHPNHSEDSQNELLAHCVSRNLLISGGSDCHGKFVTTRTIGNPKVYKDMIKLK